jgi:oxalate decarboxylase
MKSSGLSGRVGEKDKHDKSSSLSATNGAFTRPEPIRGDEGVPIIGPTNLAREAESPSRLAPPETDHGTLPSLKWSFADSHNRLEPEGWAWQTTGRELAIAKALNCVNMRLKAGAIRELQWHQPYEWGFVFKGRVRVRETGL